VRAVVNYFTGAECRAVRRFLRLEGERMRAAVHDAVREILRKHRGRMAILRPKHVASLLLLPPHPVALSVILSLMPRVVVVDGREWRVAREEGSRLFYVRAS